MDLPHSDLSSDMTLAVTSDIRPDLSSDLRPNESPLFLSAFAALLVIAMKLNDNASECRGNDDV